MLIIVGRGVLRQIAEEFNAKIDISKSLNVLRITGDLSTCISTLKLIILMQEEIACGQIDLETLESGADGRTRGDRLSDTLLQQIEQSTNTVIRRPMQGRTESRAPYQGRAEVSLFLTKINFITEMTPAFRLLFEGGREKFRRCWSPRKPTTIRICSANG